MKRVYGEHSLGRTAMNNWCKCFRQDRYSVKDAPRVGQVNAAITDASAAAVDEIVRNERRVTTREISEKRGLVNEQSLRTTQ